MPKSSASRLPSGCLRYLLPEAGRHLLDRDSTLQRPSWVRNLLCLTLFRVSEAEGSWNRGRGAPRVVSERPPRCRPNSVGGAILFTMGHSTRTLDEFVGLLQATTWTWWPMCARHLDLVGRHNSPRLPWPTNCHPWALDTSTCPSWADSARRKELQPIQAGATRVSAASPTTCRPLPLKPGWSNYWRWLCSTLRRSCAQRPSLGAATDR